MKVTQSIGILSLFTLLGTSISHAAETPVDITNKEGNVAVSSNYEPDGVTLTTQQGQILYNFQEIKKRILLLCLKYDPLFNIRSSSSRKT